MVFFFLERLLFFLLQVFKEEIIFIFAFFFFLTCVCVDYDYYNSSHTTGNCALFKNDFSSGKEDEKRTYFCHHDTVLAVRSSPLLHMEGGESLRIQTIYQKYHPDEWRHVPTVAKGGQLASGAV